MRAEHFGALRLELSEDKVIAELGAPVRGNEETWEATGDHVEPWDYPAKGVHLWMASAEPGGKRRVLAIRVSAPSKRKTHRNIGIGSSEEEVRRAYKEYEDTTRTEQGGSFVAGTVYGGVIFEIQRGVVSEIFVGAASE